MATTVAQIDAWRSAPSEHQNLEFKEAKNQFDNDKLYRTCVAIANEGGGHLLLGIADARPHAVVGTAAFDNPVKMAAKMFNALGFRVNIEEVDHPDGRVLVFRIPSRSRGTAFQYQGAYLMRAGEGTVPMSEDCLRTIFAEGQPDWLEEPAVINCPDEKVIELVDTQGYFDLMKLPYPSDRPGVLERLAGERIISAESGGWTITNLGAILFAKNFKDFSGPIARKAPRVIVYDGQGKSETLQDVIGVKGYAVGFQGLIGFIKGVVPSNEVITQALRREVEMFPAIAIRELVANAMIHQDFSQTGTSLVIEIYSDRMEISNPGKPFIPIDRFIDEYQSRNERLADLMRRIGICEEKGSGIDKVIAHVEAYQLPAPDFRVGELRTTAVLFGHKSVEEMDRDDRVRACYQHCVLRYVMNQPATNQSLRERLRLPETKVATVSQIIAATVEAGKIKIANPGQTSTRYRNYIPYWA